MMFPSTNFYGSRKKTNQFRRDSVLDPPFEYYFDAEEEDSVCQVLAFGQDSSQALWDTYCPSDSSCSATSSRQSLLPPLPHSLSTSVDAPVPGKSRARALPRRLPATALSRRNPRRPLLETASKRSITILQLEQLRQSPLPVLLHSGRKPPYALASNLNHSRPLASSFPSTSTSVNSSTLHSEAPSVSNSRTMTTAVSSVSAPRRNGWETANRSQSGGPPKILQQECVPSTVQGRAISLPLETKSTSAFGADFDFGLPGHDFESRRPSPSPLPGGTGFSARLPFSTSKVSLATATSPSSPQPYLPASHEGPREMSAFDSDSDEERPSLRRKAISKMVSQPRLKAYRTRARTVPTGAVPAANRRIISTGASVKKRISKQDIRTVWQRGCHTPDNGAGCVVSPVSTPDSSSTSPDSSSPAGGYSPLASRLRQKQSKKESPPKSTRTSAASKASNTCGDSKRRIFTPAGGRASEESGEKASSGKNLRSWFMRVFGRRNNMLATRVTGEERA